MHYKNGREAKNGDKVVLIPAWGLNPTPVVGILYDAVAGNDTCNGKLAVTRPNDPCPNLQECLHLDDVLAALPGTVPDTSLPAPAPVEQAASADAPAADPPAPGAAADVAITASSVTTIGPPAEQTQFD